MGKPNNGPSPVFAVDDQHPKERCRGCVFKGRGPAEIDPPPLRIGKDTPSFNRDLEWAPNSRTSIYGERYIAARGIECGHAPAVLEDDGGGFAGLGIGLGE